jgi:ABC-type branched-subunit amino acid transport system ATPase component
LLEVRSLTKRFGGLLAVSDVSFKVHDSSIMGLIGPNGSGKTTVLNLIMGFESADSGEVLFEGRRLTGKKPHQIARAGIGTTFQLTRVFSSLTVLQNLVLASRNRGGDDIKRASELLDFLNISRMSHEKAGSLSYGQRKLVELGRSLMLDPKIILLDEPTAGVNPVLIDEILLFIKKLKDEKHMSFLLIEHNINVVSELCGTVVALNYGEIISEGTPEDVLSDSRVVEAYLGHA